MKTTIFVVLALSLITNASLIHHEHRGTHIRGHHRVSARAPSSLVEAPLQKRCKTRGKPYKVTSSSATPAKSQEPKKDTPKKTEDKKPAGDSGNAKSFIGGGGGGLIKASSNCGGSGATKAITSTSGPNGNIEFLNCGIRGGGWKPPHVTVDQLITANFETALDDPNTPFKACRPFWNTFRNYANQHGFSPMILAAIAMQESSCNPDTTGGGGEQGLMQITKEKCGGAPGGNCKDPDFNIRTGAAFFAATLNGSGGNVVATLGKYNGWYEGLTEAKATAARYSDCCRCQNNLDYLHQTFNGWLQNRPANGLGVFHNLAVC